MLRAIREIQPTYVVGENVLGLVNWNGGLVFNEVQADLEAEGYEVQPFVLPACAVNAPHRRDRVWFVAKNTKCDGLLFREPIKEGAEIWEQRNACAGSSVRIHLSEGNATNSDCNGQQQCDSQYEVNASEGGINAQRNINKSNGYRNASDAIGIRPQIRSEKGNIRKKETTSLRKRSKLTVSAETNGSRYYKSKWQSFPTQSPICAGDDGISSRLDGITFSKWRNESIKAAGNAIVPQVVYQIFQAISKMP
jgi:DNA (cytosine-5)-methyltransferase 1